MASSPRLNRIVLYPIKSLDGAVVNEASVSAGGALAGDREFCLRDASGQFVNGKRTERVCLLRAEFDWPRRLVKFSAGQGASSLEFHLDEDRAPIEAWLGDFFGEAIRFERNSETGFPDDLEAHGPTLWSNGTVGELTSWLPEISPGEIRRRFRVNLEVGASEPFWEDRLFAEPGQVVEFSVGEVRFEGTNPCQRCVVPTRNPDTGEALAGFQKVITARRAETLPAWAARSRFNHFYRIALNTRIPRSEAGKILRVGDPLQIHGTKSCS